VFVLPSSEYNELRALACESKCKLVLTLFPSSLPIYFSGSCLSGLALEGSHDVDISIYIPELHKFKTSFDNHKISGEEYEKNMRRIIFRVRDALQYCRSVDFFDLFAITRARVPVVKGTMLAENPYTNDGHLAFDLCFLNEIAVVNSSLLREYSLLDNRVRLLMLSVKSYAKHNGIASAAEGTLSSYSWLNLVVFYLQCIGMLPVLQCPQMMEEHDFQPDPADSWHSVNSLETYFLTRDIVVKKDVWQPSAQVKEANLGSLLYGFFHFYSSVFPDNTVAASIRFGKITLQKTVLHDTSKIWRICIEDPFETCNSHCPHDLGCHVKEDGQITITHRLRQATNELGALMQQQKSGDDNVSVLLSRLLGPVHKDASDNPQSKNHGNAPTRRNNKNKPGAKDGQTRKEQRLAKKEQRPNQKNVRDDKRANGGGGKQGHNPTHNTSSMSARSQMNRRNGNRPAQTQVKHPKGKPLHKGRNGQNGNHSKHAHPKDRQHDQPTKENQTLEQGNVHPENDKEFIQKQKEKLHQIHEEKKRKGKWSKQKKKGVKSNEGVGAGGKQDKHKSQNTNRNESGHHAKNGSKTNGNKSEN